MYFVASTVIEGANKDRFVCSFTAIFDATLHYFANNLAYKNTRYTLQTLCASTTSYTWYRMKGYKANNR